MPFYSFNIQSYMSCLFIIFNIRYFTTLSTLLNGNFFIIFSNLFLYRKGIGYCIL